MVLNLAIVVAIQREDVRQAHSFQRLLTISYVQQSVDEQGLIQHISFNILRYTFPSTFPSKKNGPRTEPFPHIPIQTVTFALASRL
jgi:hypothetical protein